MKKFSDNSKGSKGFYAALGISAVMIGSACYFAYDQGEKMTNDLTAKQIQAEKDLEAAVDKRVNNLPKGTTPAYKLTTTPSVTSIPRPAATAPPVETLPAEAIIIDPAEPVIEEIHQDTETAGTSKLANVKPPLAEFGDVVGSFSDGELVKSPTTGSWQTHNGTDLAAEVGAEVYAVSNGEVTEVTKDSIWGVTVVINHHNGYITRYCGLSDSLSVQQGDVLVSGDLIGTVGNTADIESAIAPHLHIEMLHNGSYIDPMAELTK